MNKEKSTAFMLKVVSDVAAGMTVQLVHVGDRVGLFKAMAGAGALTTAQLADRTGVRERYLEEWLAAMYCSGYVEHDAQAGSWTLPDEHALFFAQASSEYYLGGLFKGAPDLAAMAPRLADAFLTGEGIPFEAFGAGTPLALEHMNRAVYEARLVKVWLPTLPTVVQALHAGGRAIDIGCGTGVIPVLLAQAFPQARVSGLDIDTRSLDLAADNARKAGVEDRVRWVKASASNWQPEPGGYDFVSSFDCLQDGLRYVRYRLDLAATDTVALEMRRGSFESQLDSYLELFDSSGTTRIASADDLVPGEDLTARIARPLAAGRYYVVARQASGTSFGAYALHYRKARLGVPAALRVVAGDNQVAAPGATAAVQPTVRVVDEVEYPVAGITVGFAVAGGVGAVGAAQVTSDASGLASAPWTLGAGPNVLVATRFDVRSALFNAKGKASTTGFDIALRFVAEPSAAHLAAFAAAVARWEAVITSDVASTPLSAPLGTCYSDRAIDETVDDVVIIVRLAPIDGVGSVLGSADP